MVEKSQSNVAHLERIRAREQEDKALLEKETVELGNKMNEFMDRLDDAIAALEKEQNIRGDLEKELEIMRKKEAEHIDQKRALKDELQNLLAATEKSLEVEQQNNMRLVDENENLQRIIRAKAQQYEEMQDRMRALEQELAENVNKNEQLVGLLNQEIDRQAEEYKQRALGVLLNSPSRTMDSKKWNSELAERDSILDSKYRRSPENLRRIVTGEDSRSGKNLTKSGASLAKGSKDASGHIYEVTNFDHGRKEDLDRKQKLQDV